MTMRNQRTLAKARLGPKSRARARFRVIAKGRGNAVLAQQRSTNLSAAAPPRRAKTKSVGDWFIGLSCLLALVLAVAIGNAATLAAGKNPLEPDGKLANAVSAPNNADDYVEGLAKSPGCRALRRLQQLDLERVPDMRAEARPVAGCPRKARRSHAQAPRAAEGLGKRLIPRVRRHVRVMDWRGLNAGLHRAADPGGISSAPAPGRSLVTAFKAVDGEMAASSEQRRPIPRARS
jgi:hypothetical protein